MTLRPSDQSHIYSASPHRPPVDLSSARIITVDVLRGFEGGAYSERAINEAVRSVLEFARTQSILSGKLPADLKFGVVISVHPEGSEQLIETTLSAKVFAELGRLILGLHIGITPVDR